jgi:predicted aspartyl protease
VRALCLLIAAVLAPAVSAAGDENRVPFTRGAHGEVVVPVLVNGAGLYPFALDTGSSHTAIAESLSADLAAPAVARSELSTPAGSATRRIVELAGLQVGARHSGPLLATELPDEALDPARVIRGVLGQDVLAATRYTIDFARRAILWDAPEPANGARLTLVRTDRGGVLAELPQRDRIVRMVPDSGAEALVLFERAGRTLPLPGQFEPGAREVSTLVARRAARRVRIHELHLGRFVFTDWPAVVLPAGDLPPAHGDGLLPLAAFDRVTMDVSSGWMIVDPGGRRR